MDDYFTNAVFIEEKYKSILNAKIEEYFQCLCNELEAHDIKANIYLTGSLARKEPSVGINEKGEVYLASDIDFVFGVEKDFRRDEWLLNITKYLNLKYPDFISSVVLTRNNDIGRIRSRVGRDLRRTINRPICQNLPIPIVSNIEIGIQDYIHNIINQMACYFLHPSYLGGESHSILYKDIKGHYVKLILESLSGILYESRKEPLPGFYEIYYYRHCKYFDQIILPKQIEQLLQVRSLKNAKQIPSLDIYHILVNTFERILGERYGVAGDLVELVKVKANDEKGLYNTFQVSMICLFEYMHIQDTDERERWLELLFDSLFTIEKSEKINLHIKNLKLKDCRNPFEVLPLIISDMRVVRNYYIRSQYIKNNGVDIIPDLYA